MNYCARVSQFKHLLRNIYPVMFASFHLLMIKSFTVATLKTHTITDCMKHLRRKTHRQNVINYLTYFFLNCFKGNSTVVIDMSVELLKKNFPLSCVIVYCVSLTGIISRSEAEDQLRSKWDGSFLIRLSDKIWGYVISYRCTDQRDPSAAKFKHFLIVASPAGYCLFGADDFVHATLNDLVEYHSVSC